MWNRPAVVPGRGWWSGAAASHTGLAAAGRDGSGPALGVLRGVPTVHRRPPGSTRPTFSEALDKHPLTFEVQPGYLRVWELSTSPLLTRLRDWLFGMLMLINCDSDDVQPVLWYKMC